MSLLDADLVLLDEVAQQYFNISPLVARRKAALQTLPIPAFRITGMRHGPLYVRKSDITKLSQTAYDRAMEVNAQMRSVTAASSEV